MTTEDQKNDATEIIIPTKNDVESEPLDDAIGEEQPIDKHTMDKSEPDNTTANARCSCLTKECAFAFFDRNQFVMLLLLAIATAKAYPPLGAEYLQPDITATWIAVMIIFLISGVGLNLEEFSQAVQRLYFNSFVQLFNFGFVSLTVFGITRFLKEVTSMNAALADGMVICSCLPMAINVVIVLTGAAGGDEAAAIFNTTIGNIIGIFLSPALILLYLGTTGDITLPDVFLKLALRVILPLCIGLALRRISDTVAKLVTGHKKKLKRTQEYCLIFIVYTVFCQTFEEGMNAGVTDILLTIFLQLSLMISFMCISWYSLQFVGFADEPGLRVMGLFGCSGKTIALGVPLINAIYENDPQRALYTLPLLIWHPLQLLIGSSLAPRLAKFVDREKERLRLRQSEQESDDKSSPQIIEATSTESAHKEEDDLEDARATTESAE